MLGKDSDQIHNLYRSLENSNEIDEEVIALINNKIDSKCKITNTNYTGTIIGINFESHLYPVKIKIDDRDNLILNYGLNRVFILP